MAAPIQLRGGKVGKKNTNARSAAHQRPNKSKPVKTRAAKVRKYTGKKTNGTKPVYAASNAVTKPTVPVMKGHGPNAMYRFAAAHGAYTSRAGLNRSILSAPADMTGATNTGPRKSTKKTVYKVTGKTRGQKGRVAYTGKSARGTIKPRKV